MEKNLNSNKLIAEFMGWSHKSKEQLWKDSRMSPHHCPNGSWTDPIDSLGHFSLHFDSSLDWLHPAWVKFWKEAFSHTYETDEPLRRVIQFRARYHSALDEYDFEKAYLIVVEAIQWFHFHVNKTEKK